MTKPIIWIAAIVGLIPVVFVSAYAVIFAIVAARAPKPPTAPSGASVLAEVSLHFGSPQTALYLSTELWPAVVALGGALAVMFALFFLLPKQPYRLRTGAFPKIETYISRLLQSPRAFGAIIIAARDGEQSILLFRQHGVTKLSISCGSNNDMSEQQKVQRFFREHGMEPLREHGMDTESQPGSGYTLEFELHGNSETITRLCAGIFTELFGLNDQDQLELAIRGL